MKMKRLVLVGFVGGILALGFSSCAYDPYYAGYGGGYGYGDGYGYGGSSFSTSLFVSTGDPRWGYDPYAGAYYDYTRRCYYDPYLSGYYPIGYRPRYVYGAPHPHGWSSGSRHCDPPSHVRNYTLTNYHNRSERYRSLGQPWSGNVRVNTGGDNRHSGYGDRDRRGSSSDWMKGSSDRGRDQRSPYTRTSDSGSIFGGNSQRPSYGGRDSAPTGIFGNRGGGRDDRSYNGQYGESRQPSPRIREFGDSGRNSNRGGGSPFLVPPPSGNRGSQSGGGFGGFGGRSGAERPAPQFERPSGGSGGERSHGNPGRGDERKIRGLGEG